MEMWLAVHYSLIPHWLLHHLHVQYDFYRREFHGLFFFSACATVLLLAVAQRIGKSRVQLSCRDEDSHFYPDMEDHEVEAIRGAEDNV